MVYENRDNGEFFEIRIRSDDEMMNAAQDRLTTMTHHMDAYDVAEVLPPVLPKCRERTGKEYQGCPLRDICLQRAGIGIEPGGCDLGVRRIALVNAESGEAHIWRPTRLNPRSEELGVLASWVSDLYLDGSCAVEAPIVAGPRNLHTAMDMAMTVGAVVSGLWRSGVVTELVPVSTWKKAVVGKGNSTKDEVAAYVSQHAPGFVSAVGQDQDAFDAWCISVFMVQHTASKLDG